ncbi:hypothetical protein HN51_000453 [Arachis hypogaea]|nr:probable protein S-acyltransferase 14 [Arachis hypogaea]QHO48359.1 putative protein S-acyltransferase [Arachis hypogaea]
MHRSRATMTWNVFKFCTTLRGLGSIMILLVFGVVGVTYYAVVLTNYSPVLSAGGLDCLLAIAVLILFHGLSYFSVVFTNSESVPLNWRPAIDEERGEDDPLVASEFGNLQSDPSGQRVCYCRKCNQLKPPRCHHCSVCEFLDKIFHICTATSTPSQDDVFFIFCFFFLYLNTFISCTNVEHRNTHDTLTSFITLKFPFLLDNTEI